MKIVSVLCLIFVSVNCFPADTDSSEDSDDRPFIYVPAITHRARFNPSVVEVDVGGDSEDADEDSFFSSFFRPLFVNPFAGFKFGGFPGDDVFARPSFFDSFTPKVDPDAKVKNATSTVKVVDGHKIVVNDTTYEDEKNGAVFRFHFIQVSPVDSEEKPDNTNPESSTEVANKVNSEEVTENKNSSPEEPSSKPDNNSADNEINREEVSPPESNGDDLKA